MSTGTSTEIGRRGIRNRFACNGTLAVVACLAAIVVAAGCGGDSKPAYCSDRSALQSSIDGLTIPTSTDDIGKLQSQLTEVQSDATALVNSAKGDFPNQTTAISSSVDALSSAVKALPAAPSASEIAAIAADASAVVNSVKSFSDATSSQCG